MPDGVRKAHSEFQMLQAQFELILINHNLLKPGERPNERTVTIPNVTITHVVGDTNSGLAYGDLTLMTASVLDTKPENDSLAVLTLSIGNMTFSLHRKTVFGTVTENDRTYVFNPEIGEGQGESVVDGFVSVYSVSEACAYATFRYVKVVLPEEVTSNQQLRELQEQFEQILIDYGLLKEGVEAIGDELGRSAHEDATNAADLIRATTKECVHLYCLQPVCTDMRTVSSQRLQPRGIRPRSLRRHIAPRMVPHPPPARSIPQLRLSRPVSLLLQPPPARGSRRNSGPRRQVRRSR
ncbi:uncharacterized protein PHACADRAFT_263012 [Phanerochaete carnosa HHB-10118-sp]|uniref:Uncharacterized protein n=1 Tax=Phanerochaete carnosa (strain HHB-10118-sp) TaxID=650164 RepID=K5VIE9_PHACS|nr:uncharacterized protein PHACADRAFT_263012 [Phanerochaete carnosa HHB-10118-sp]EKM51053.1 hypothetical protein PHACADRAFT_263012 [Phanerochaete carnosa HHB-10118-sp]